MDLGAVDEYDDADQTDGPSVATAQTRNVYKGTQRLSDAERARLSKEGRCFRCKGVGHLARGCPARPPQSTQSKD